MTSKVLTVLLVEDNPLNAELVCALLERHGHAVAHARDAAAFRRELRARRHDVVLMDIMLPDGDGSALLDEVNADERHASVPVIAVTAQAFAADIEQFVARGFDAVITKPIDVRTFVATVVRTLQGAAP